MTEVTRASWSPQPSEPLRPRTRASVPVLKASVSICTPLPAARAKQEALAGWRLLPSAKISPPPASFLGNKSSCLVPQTAV